MLRSRKRRIRSHSINRLIPNMLTMLALCAGLSAIRFALQDRWEAAILAVAFAALLDALDGRIARLIDGTSKFGAELDSLSDVVCFGVVPALILYLWTMSDVGGIGWGLCLLYPVCCALRLARFNTGLGSTSLPASYFEGVPAPAAAGLVLLPVMLTFQTGPGIFDHPAVVGVFLVGVALLMISTLPTFSFKRFRVPGRWVLPTLLAVGVLAASLAGAPWTTFSVLLIAYLVSIPFSVHRCRRRLRRDGDGSADTSGPDETGDEPPSDASPSDDTPPAAEPPDDAGVVRLDRR